MGPDDHEPGGAGAGSVQRRRPRRAGLRV